MPVSLDTLRVNHSVQLRNAGYAALANACAEYPTGHRYAYVRETLDGEEVWECPCGQTARNAREAGLPLMGEEDPHWDEMVAYAGEFRPRLAATERVIRDVKLELAEGKSLAEAIAYVQHMEDSARLADDAPYGPFVQVAGVWERYQRDVTAAFQKVVPALLTALRAEQPTETGNTDAVICSTCKGSGNILHNGVPEVCQECEGQ